MRQLLISLLMLLASTCLAFGQYAETPDYATTKEYKFAKTISTAGVVAAGIGAVTWIGGSIATTVYINKYTNSHMITGSAEEILDLNNEAKTQPEYKKAAAFQLGGFLALLAGGGVALLGANKMKIIETAAGEPIASLNYGVGANGISIALLF